MPQCWQKWSKSPQWHILASFVIIYILLLGYHGNRICTENKTYIELTSMGHTTLSMKDVTYMYWFDSKGWVLTSLKMPKMMILTNLSKHVAILSLLPWQPIIIFYWNLWTTSTMAYFTQLSHKITFPSKYHWAGSFWKCLKLRKNVLFVNMWPLNDPRFDLLTPAKDFFSWISSVGMNGYYISGKAF